MFPLVRFLKTAGLGHVATAKMGEIRVLLVQSTDLLEGSILLRVLRNSTEC